MLDHLTELLEQARAMPLSDSCLVNREDALALIDDVRALLPEALVEADRVIAARDDVVALGRREAERLVAEHRALLEHGEREAEQMLVDAEQEQARLVGDGAVYLRASAEADALLAQAHADAELQRRQTDEYVDAKLAQFEAVLVSTLTAVERGRSRLGQPPPEPDQDEHDVAR